jgi:hypothetical protein
VCDENAIARARFKDEAGTSTAAAKTLHREEVYYAVGISEIPSRMTALEPQDLKAGAQLVIKNHPLIQPADVQMDEGEGRTSIYLFFSKQGSGSHVITLDDKEVEVVLKAKLLDIKCRFKLADMVLSIPRDSRYPYPPATETRSTGPARAG